MRLPKERKRILSILVISVILLVCDLIFFGLTIARSYSELDKAAERTLYSVYWMGIPLLVTSFVGIIAGIRKQKALITAFMVLSIITSLVAATVALLFLMANVILCGTSFLEIEGRNSKSCNFQQKDRSLLIVMVSDAVLVFICCLIGSIFACYYTCPCCTPRRRDEPEIITLTPILTKPSNDPFS